MIIIPPDATVNVSSAPPPEPRIPTRFQAALLDREVGHTGHPLLAEFDHVRMTDAGVSNIFDFPQKIGRNGPTLSLFCDDSDRLLVVSGEHTEKWFTTFGMK